jgi:hypothetical protein
MREPTARARGREARREVAALVVEAKKPLLLALDEVAPPGPQRPDHRRHYLTALLRTAAAGGPGVVG